jgi:hypothetical protein
VFGLEMTRRRAEQLAAQETRIRQENDADDERLRKAKARRAAVIAARVKETFGFEKESLFESDSYLRHYMARLLYRIVEAGEFDDNSYLLTCYDRVAEALDGAREVHQE